MAKNDGAKLVDEGIKALFKIARTLFSLAAKSDAAKRTSESSAKESPLTVELEPLVKVDKTGKAYSALEYYNAQSEAFSRDHAKIQEAEALQEHDPHGALEQISKVIDDWPFELRTIFYWYFSKAHCLYLLGKRDEAYAVYQWLLLQLNPNSVSDYYSDKATIYEASNEQLYLEEKYRDYLWFSAYQWWDKIISTAFSGHEVDLDFDSLLYAKKRKYNKAAKAQNKGKLGDTLENAFSKFYMRHEAALKEIAKIGNDSSNWDTGYSAGEDARDIGLKGNKRFMKLHQKLAMAFHNDFEQELNNMLSREA